MTKDDKASLIFAQIQNAIIANYQLLNPCPITTYTPSGSRHSRHYRHRDRFAVRAP